MAHEIPHYPVLLSQFLDFFAEIQLVRFLDGTLGAGGHASALLKEHPEVLHFIGIDQDPEALCLAQARLERWRDKVTMIRGNFAEIMNHPEEWNVTLVDGIILDLGVSSMQLDRGERGFSFMREGPLDMRMDPTNPLTAAEIVNEWSEEELGRIFRDYGEEPRWRRAAQQIVQARRQKTITTTEEMKEVLMPILSDPKQKRQRRIHPMTLVFQALRICVNDELGALQRALPAAINLLNPGGRLGVISFHRLEDRIVKEYFRFAASDKYDTSGLSGIFIDKKPLVKLLTRKAVKPSETEVAENPRCQSAKMRFVEKLEVET